ncbi:MAG: T9SS type A sorting domain-containing protein [Sphingomonadales bacterium]|nr:T9SS type A sorting domain-containing protein [Sphingomonadales bacterium]
MSLSLRLPIHKRFLAWGVLFSAGLSTSMAQVSESNILVFEHFTNASCAPCAQQNPTFQGLMRSNPGKATAVRHHVSWPGLDSMYLANPVDPTVRVNYYGISGVPALRLGRHALSTGIGQGTLETWFNITPANWIYDLDTRLIGVGDPQIPDSVEVTGSVYSLATPDSTNRLVLFLAEDSIYYPPPGQQGGGLPGNNGEKLFPMVLRKILPDTNGINVGSGAVPTTVSFKYRLGNRWRIPHLYLTGFVQNTFTKQVHKGFKLQLGYSIHTSVEDQALGGNSLKVYPNPASESCILEWPSNAGISHEDWSVQLTDLQGRTTQILANQISFLGANKVELDLSNLSEGLYQLTISSSQARTTYSHKIFKTNP